MSLRRREPPILVVGAPRSGTTWLGTMLALAPHTFHVYEPFNPDGPRPPSPMRWPFRRKVEYVTEENEGPYLRPVRQLLGLRLPVEHFAKRMLRGRLSQWRDEAVPVVQARVNADRLVMKDSTSVFYGPWLERRFGMRLVVILRHPGGSAAGYKRMKWTQDLSFLLEQPLLMRDLLEPYREDIEVWNRAFRAGTADPLDLGVLWWRMSMHAAAVHLERQPSWIAVRHEQLSREPETEFPALYARLGLDWTPEVAAAAVPLTRGKAAEGELGKTLHVLERSSAAVASDWKKRLDTSEIDRILRSCEREATRLGIELDP